MFNLKSYLIILTLCILIGTNILINGQINDATGSFVVLYLFPESKPTTENLETWSTTRVDEVISQLNIAKDWWVDKAPFSADLSITSRLFYPEVLPIDFEPITMSAGNESDWINDCMDELGFSNFWHDYQWEVDSLNKYYAKLAGVDKGYSIFIVDSFNDTDNRFSDGKKFAYAYFGGPFAVLTWGNGPWREEFEKNHMQWIGAHEMGHIFRAADQYPGSNRCSYSWNGYSNENSKDCPAGSYVGSIMSQDPSTYPPISSTNTNIDYWAQGMFNWNPNGYPSNPTNITSSSHQRSVWSSNRRININWNNGTEPNSGIEGYAWRWSQSSNSVPDKVVDGSGNSTMSSLLSDGNNWYFHLITKSNSKYWEQSTKHYGPFYIDGNSPQSGTISINNGLSTASSLIVNLNNLNAADGAGSGVSQMRFSNNNSNWSNWQAYTATKSNWDLTSYGGNSNEGSKTVYVKYKDQAGNISNTYQDNIVYSPSKLPPPTLSQPSNESTITERTPYFDWSYVNGATEFDIQVDNNSNFSSHEIDKTRSNSYYQPSSGLDYDTYYWRVRAKNSTETSNWSEEWNFTISESLSLASPILSKPSNNSSTTNRTPYFEWSDIDGTTWYEIEVGLEPDFQSLKVLDKERSNSHYQVIGDHWADNTYYWRVVARNTTIDSEWSTAWKFEIINNPPIKHELIAPDSGYVVTQRQDILFDWSYADTLQSELIKYKVFFSGNQINWENEGGYLTTSEFTISPSNRDWEELEDITYFWKVVVYKNGEFQSESNVWYFKIDLENDNYPPEKPLLITPRDNFTLTSEGRITFSWSCSDPDGDTLRYYLYAKEENQRDFERENMDTLNSLESKIMKEKDNGKYYWYVTAYDESGVLRNSDTLTFIISINSKTDISGTIKYNITNEPLKDVTVTLDGSKSIVAGSDGGNIPLVMFLLVHIQLRQQKRLNGVVLLHLMLSRLNFMLFILIVHS